MIRKKLVLAGLIITMGLSACGGEKDTVVDVGNMERPQIPQSSQSQEEVGEEETEVKQEETVNTKEDVSIDEEVSTNEEQKESAPFQLVDSFSPNGVWRVYNGGKGIIDDPNDTDALYEYEYVVKESVIYERGKRDTYREGEEYVYPLEELSKYIYRVENSENVAEVTYVIQKEDTFDIKKECIQCYREYHYHSADVIKFDSAEGKAKLYSYSKDGEIIEDGWELIFGYLEEDNTLLFFDEDGIVTDEWSLEVSNGVIVITMTDTGNTAVLVRIDEMPESVEPSVR